MVQSKEPLLAVLVEMAVNGPAKPEVEYSILTFPVKPSERQRMLKWLFWGRRSAPLGLVTKTYWSGLLEASAVLPYAPRLTYPPAGAGSLAKESPGRPPSMMGTPSIFSRCGPNELT